MLKLGPVMFLLQVVGELLDTLQVTWVGEERIWRRE